MNPITAILIMRGTYILPGIRDNSSVMRHPAHLADGITIRSACADFMKGGMGRSPGHAAGATTSDPALLGMAIGRGQGTDVTVALLALTGFGPGGVVTA